MSMSKNTLDPNRKLVQDFQTGRISRRQFLAAVTAMMGAATVAAVPAFAAPKPLGLARARRQAEPTLMIYAASQDIATIDPFDRTDYSIGAVMRQMYDRLFRFEGGWPAPVDPGLAQTWSASEDASEWTFTITDKAVFHDGTPLTSADVVFSYQATLRAQKPRSSLLSGFLDVDGITAPDATTVVMKLKTPYGAFDRFLAFVETPIANMALCKANETDGDDGAAWLIDHEAGSGPFMQGDWQIGSRYEMTAVDDYWQGWPGESHLSGVVWVKTEDPGTRKTGLLSGDFDMIDTVSANDIAEIDGNEATVAEVNYGLLGGYLKYNTQTGPTADVNFRKFLAYSFDKQAFSDSQLGYVALMTGPLPEGVPGYDPDLDPQYSYDPVKAKEHLDMTEYKDGGFSLDFVYVSGLDFEEAGGLILLAELQKYNITLNMVPKNWPDIVGACTSPETGPAIGFIFDAFPPLADTWLVEKYSSASWDRPTGGSFVACSFYKNEEVDAWIDELRVTTDPDHYAELVDQIQTQVSEDAPDMPLYVGPNIVAYNNKVKGYLYYGDISVDFWRLWIDNSGA
jgi:peptide/nickel transport system substrate-binding protein